MALEGLANDVFVRKAVAEGVRLDGRNLLDFRRVSFDFSTEAYGQVCVSLGSTVVSGTVTNDIVAPSKDRPAEGLLLINVDYPLPADGNANNAVTETRLFVERVIKASKWVKLESLSITPGKWVWLIRLQVVILNNDGNIRDASALAAIAALSHFRLPSVETYGDGSLKAVSAVERLPLCVEDHPSVATLAYMKPEDCYWVDASIDEERIVSGRISVAIDKEGHVVAIYKAGGDAIPLSTLLHYIKVASETAVAFSKQLYASLLDNKRQRQDRWWRRSHSGGFQTIDYQSIRVSSCALQSTSVSTEVTPEMAMLSNTWVITARGDAGVEEKMQEAKGAIAVTPIESIVLPISSPINVDSLSNPSAGTAGAVMVPFDSVSSQLFEGDSQHKAVLQTITEDLAATPVMLSMESTAGAAADTAVPQLPSTEGEGFDADAMQEEEMEFSRATRPKRKKRR